MAKKKPLGQRIADDVLKQSIKGLRNAAKDVLNELVEASPNWSGDFRESWYVETGNGKQGARAGTVGTGYQLWNIPLISLEEARKGRVELFIGNLAPYATVAMDLEPGEFVYPGFEPQGDVVLRGERQGGIRGQVDGQGRSRATAPLDWYTTYMEGGSFNAAFNRGAEVGFLNPAAEPRSRL